VAALNHPHILSIFDLGSDDGTTYVVFELLEGRSLQAVLAEGALPARKAAASFTVTSNRRISS
jgi:serine/threonine-protein kinase